MSDVVDEHYPHWNNSTRVDGWKVRQALDGWVIVPPGDGKAVISLCPCCQKPFREARFAILTADKLFPPP